MLQRLDMHDVIGREADRGTMLSKLVSTFNGNASHGALDDALKLALH